MLARSTYYKIPTSSNGTTVDGYLVGIVNTSDYSPFGVQLDGRTVSDGRYRFGFNGMEMDNEVSGNGNSINYKYRMHCLSREERIGNPRIGRWLSIDPKRTAWESPYVSMGNNPILYNDVLGDTIKVNPKTAATPEYQMWLSSKAGKKFISLYGAGKKYGHINIEIGPASTYETKVNGAANTGLFIKRNGIKYQVVSNENYKKLEAGGKNMSRYVTKVKSSDAIIFKISINSVTNIDTDFKDTREKALNLLHETQHVRIIHYSIRMYGYYKYNSSEQHKLMLNNKNSSSYYTQKINSKWRMPNGNNIYDFNSERWNFLKEYKVDGESDSFRDKKAYQNGISTLKEHGR